MVFIEVGIEIALYNLISHLDINKYKIYVTYTDKNAFEILRIVCTYGSEVRVYEIEAKYLKATSKSIYFDAVQDGGSFNIAWKPKEVAPHIKRIK